MRQFHRLLILVFAELVFFGILAKLVPALAPYCIAGMCIVTLTLAFVFRGRMKEAERAEFRAELFTSRTWQIVNAGMLLLVIAKLVALFVKW